jgi:hypothetical protein
MDDPADGLSPEPTWKSMLGSMPWTPPPWLWPPADAYGLSRSSRSTPESYLKATKSSSAAAAA